MGEKRRLSARERREPAAKRRVSEAPQSQAHSHQSSSKRKSSAAVVAPTPTPPPPPPPEVIENPLPTKIKDGEGLPVLPSPQSVTLSPKEFQSIAESAVLLASLERSKKKWLSDGILVRYWTKPKKTKREQIEGKNPPKETMSKVGACTIAVGPHRFDAMLYTVKDPNAPPPIQYTPPQRPMVHYGPPNNFQQYQPYPPPTPHQQARPHPSQNRPANSASPQPTFHQGSHPTPPHHARTPNNPPHRQPSGPQSAPRQSPSQNPQTQPAKPSPDPVIQMLATRAASDPDLKALMRVVASSKASQEQLRAFQAHIDELNAIIRAREQQQQRQSQQPQPHYSHPPTPTQPQALPRTPQQGPASSQKPAQPAQPPQPPQTGQKPQTPAQSQPQEQSHPRVEVHVPKTPSSKVSTPETPNTNAPNPTQTSSTHKPNATPQVKQEPGVGTGQSSVAELPANSKQSSPAVRPMAPPQNQPAGPRPGPPYPPYQQPPYQGHPPAIQSRPPQYESPTPYYRPAPPPPPPRLNYKSVVFEFTSPLTPYGSSTSGHAGSGDRYLFPEHTILEWLPDGNTVLASFLLVKKVDPNTPFPIETAPDTTNSRAKGKSTSRSKKGDKSKSKAAERDKDKEDKDKGKQGEKETKEKETETNKDTEKETEKEKEKEKEEKPETNVQPPTTEGSPGPDNKAPPTTEAETKPASDPKDQPAATPSKPDPKAQPTDKKDDSNLKEYYQPVTFRITSPNPKVLEPLTRVVKSPDEVVKYMNEIMDRAERAPDGFLAYRLPKEDTGDDHEAEKKKSETPVPVNRSRLSRGKTVDEESDVENREDPVEDEEEEVLRDFYGPPTGLLSMGP
ncbi:hypothetical protein BDV25DRAFT_150305 [Aspergillus avenaceus]|uniref:SWR1-complex protein 3 domain-containing protein n=1 Tax=Aspergillus avenaceus TaxID=36643 RepID=A0A5N6U3M8_ASPAV|nr:hypothetical protein BDV25DRAFT_150305 [Aspergillus avenaceus]